MSERSPRPADDLDISVLIATRNRAAQLAETLAAYAELDTTDLAWELVLIDNASEDTTPDVIERAANVLPIVYRHNNQAGKNRALNAALDEARGALVVFADDDALPAPDSLKKLSAAAERWSADAIFGAQIVPRFPPGTPSWLASPAFEFGATAYARYAPADSEGPVSLHPFGPTFAVRRAIIGAHRFPEHLGPSGTRYAMGGEGGFLRALAADGHRYIYVPSACVEHVIRPEQTEAAWLMQRARNKGRGQVHLPSRKKARRLFVAGVSVKLWLATLRAWLRYRLTAFGHDDRRRLHYGIRYALRAGEVEERRRIYRSPRDPG